MSEEPKRQRGRPKKVELPDNPEVPAKAIEPEVTSPEAPKLEKKKAAG